MNRYIAVGENYTNSPIIPMLEPEFIFKIKVTDLVTWRIEATCASLMPLPLPPPPQQLTPTI